MFLRTPRTLLAAVVLLAAGRGYSQPAPFKLAPAVAVEAEDFQIESGWKVVQNGDGNYMVDIIGFNHISGERLLWPRRKNDNASAFTRRHHSRGGQISPLGALRVPRLLRDALPRRRSTGRQDVLDQVMGTKDSLRYGFGDPVAKAQHDPSWGPEGLMEEVVTVPELKAGKARIYLKGVGAAADAGRRRQPQHRPRST